MDLIKHKAGMDISDEYLSIRSEILTWISVQYTLIAITSSVTAISLSVFKGTSNWPWFSAIMIIIVACLGLLTAFTQAKITIAGAYISVFHPQRTVWDHLVYSKLKFKWTVATVGFLFPMLLFYLALYTFIVFYPALIYKSNWDLDVYEILSIPSVIYFLMLVVFWRSGRREPYEKIWKSFK